MPKINPFIEISDVKLVKALSEGDTLKKIAIDNKVCYHRIKNYFPKLRDRYGCNSGKALITVFIKQGLI
jgi:DNA-binding NarL/FixJ family response regulator